MDQFCAWFELDHITASAAQFNTEKLNWLNAHYLKQADDARLAAEVATRLQRQGVDSSGFPELARVMALYKGRVSNLNELADAAHPFCVAPHPAPELLAQHVTEPVREALRTLVEKLEAIDWQAPALAGAIKETITTHGMKMPQLAVPLRVVLLGQPQSPSIDAVLEVLGPERVQERLRRVLDNAH